MSFFSPSQSEWELANASDSGHTKTRTFWTTTIDNLIPLSDGMCKSDRPQQVAFTKRVQNYVLAGPVVMTKLVSSDKECQLACIRSMKCDTFNLGPRDDSFGHTCQILRFGVLNYIARRKKGWSFRARKVTKAGAVSKVYPSLRGQS